MPYTPTTWVPGSAPGISAAELQRIDDGVDTAIAHAESEHAPLEAASALVDLTDVSIYLPADGQVLTYDAYTGLWMPAETQVPATSDPIGFITFTWPGDLEVGATDFEWPVPFDLTVLWAKARVSEAPTGTSIKIDLNDDGTTMFSTKPEIAVSGFTSTAQAPSAGSMVAGSIMSCDIDQIGSGDPGVDLLVTVKFSIDAGAPAGAYPFVFSVRKELEVEVRPFVFVVPFDCTVLWSQSSLGVAGTGSGSVVIDWLKDGTTLYTTPGDRPTIAYTAQQSDQEVPAVTALLEGDELELEIVSICGTLPGENLTVTLLVTVP